MKKEYKVALFSVLVVVFLLLTRGVKFIPIVYVLQHISAFALIAFILYVLIDYFTRKFLEKTSDKSFQSTIILYRTIVFMLLLVMTLGVQVTYIRKNDTLYERSCQYYDLHNNLVFMSMYTGECPDINVTTQNNDEMAFFVEQTLTGMTNFELLNARGFDIYTDQEVTVSSRIDIRVVYNDDFDITTYDIRLTEAIRYSLGESEFDPYYSYHRTVDTEYLPTFSMTVKEADKILSSVPNASGTPVHYGFTEEDYTEVLYFEKHITDGTDYFSDHVIMKQQLFPEVKDPQLELELRRHPTQVSADIYYGAANPENMFMETSMSSDDNNLMLNKRISIDLQSSRVYSIDYQKKDDVWYLYRMGEINDFGPVLNFESTYNHLMFENETEGYEYLTNGKNDVIEFHETDYGMKVINKRIPSFNWFQRNEDQLKEMTFKYEVNEYRTLQNTVLQVRDFPYYDPPYVLKDYPYLFFIE